MSNFKMITYREECVYTGPHFFILNKGLNSGKPQQNAIVERFNRTYREDILDANMFFSLHHVYQVTKPWKEDYNEERPHEALNYCTPNEYAA